MRIKLAYKYTKYCLNMVNLSSGYKDIDKALLYLITPFLVLYVALNYNGFKATMEIVGIR